MPGNIHRLSDSVIDRIAAGEVIERPASVVKELVENALDAGGNNLRVTLGKGGLERITVADDGGGMTAADLALCIERHATSKLRDADDLFHILTLGFRGEALSSIAAVSRLTITTRQPGCDAGHRLVVHGGSVVEQGAVGCPIGTSVEVCDLFFNTPARRKFMRAPATEQTHSLEACMRVALGARQGGIVVEAGERRLLDIPERARGADRIRAALGRRSGTLHEVSRRSDGVSVSGFISGKDAARADTRGLWIFVNGRFVRDRMLQRALQDAMRNVLPAGRYPLAVLHIDVDPSCVDVNVHPQKTEVRFGDGNVVYRAVSGAVTAVAAQAPGLSSTRDPCDAIDTPPMPMASRPLPTGPEPGRALHGAMQLFYGQSPSRPTDGGDPPPHDASGQRRAPSDREQQKQTELADRVELAEQAEQEAQARAAFARRAEADQVADSDLPALNAGRLMRSIPLADGAALEILGTVLGRFVFAQNEDALVCVDVRRARVALAWATIQTELQDRGSLRGRALLLPEVPMLAPWALGILEAAWQELAPMGFEIEPVGPQRYAIRALPAALGPIGDPAAVAMSLLGALRRVADPLPQWLSAVEHRLEALTPVAQHAARDLSNSEDEAELLSALAQRGWDLCDPSGKSVCRWLRSDEIATRLGFDSDATPRQGAARSRSFKAS